MINDPTTDPAVSDLADAAQVVIGVLMAEIHGSPTAPAGPWPKRIAATIVNNLAVVARVEPGHPAIGEDAAATIRRTLVWEATPTRNAPASPMVRDLAWKIATALYDAGHLEDPPVLVSGPTNEDIAARARAAIEAAGTTAGHIAAQLDLPLPRLQAALDCRRPFTSLQLAVIAEATGTPVGHLIFAPTDQEV